MAFTHGRVATLKIDDVGGTLRDYTTYAYNISLDLNRDTAEVSAFGNAHKDYLVGQYGGTLTFDIHYDPTFVGYLFALLISTAAGALTDIEYSVQGDAVKYGCKGFVTSVSPKSSLSDANAFSVSMQISGAVTLA
jgi:hypothetical protein